MSNEYQRVKDKGKRPVRGLWKRGSKFYARLTLEDDEGRKAVKWIPLEAATIPQAIDELNAKKVDRSKNRLKARPLSPKLTDYLVLYKTRLKHSGKKPRTVVTEKGNLTPWESIGHLRLDRIMPRHVRDVMQEAIANGKSPRTANLYRGALANVLNDARRDGYLELPLATDGVERLAQTSKRRSLVTGEQIEKLLSKTGKSKNGEQFTDYVRFLQYTGAREKEALRVRWQDVDFDNNHVTIGAEGDTKNRSGRTVDMSAKLKAHLLQMKERSGKVSEWLFPSPQRGEKDTHSKSFRESLNIIREAAKMPGFGFHDLRHHFISYAVMSGIDYMTIASWVGHKDGGVLIGKVYGHLANEHRKAMADKLNFGPTVVAANA